MSANTKIEWATHTFNPWEGCQKVGLGCDNCYAENRNARFGGGTATNWGPDAPRRRTSPANWRKPLAWNKAHEAFFAEHGYRQRVFCASLADVFDNAVDPQWRADLFNLIVATPNLDWLLLTKRIGNAQEMMDAAMRANYFGNGRWETSSAYPLLPLKNVWVGATVINQEEADRDIPKLLRLPAAKRFLSIEPMLAPIDLSKYINYCEKLVKQGISRRDGGQHIVCDAHCGITWVIAGGESGPSARPMHPQWARSLRDQCTAAGVPFLFKQWGEWLPWLEFGRVGIKDKPEQTKYLTTIWQEDRWEDCGRPLWCDMTDNYRGGANGPEDSDQILGRVGKKAAGRMLDGVEHNEFPS